MNPLNHHRPSPLIRHRRIGIAIFVPLAVAAAVWFYVGMK